MSYKLLKPCLVFPLSRSCQRRLYVSPGPNGAFVPPSGAAEEPAFAAFAGGINAEEEELAGVKNSGVGSGMSSSSGMGMM